MKKQIIIAVFFTLTATVIQAADYVVDTAHSSIHFKAKHFGFSWLTGHFKKFNGTFTLGEDSIGSSKILINIDTTSLDSFHAARNKHLRGSDFLDVVKYPVAKFVSTEIKPMSDGKIAVTGDFTLRGVTRSILINVEKIGEGDDPWGGHRAGFSGITILNLDDYHFPPTMGSGMEVYIELNIEGKRR